MKSLLLLALAITFFLAESSAQQNLKSLITYNDTATIKIIAENIIDTVNIRSIYWSMVPYTFNNYNFVKITKPGTYYIRHAIPKPGSCSFYEQDFEVFIIPGDTVELKLNVRIDENRKAIVDFETTDAINNYFRAKSKKRNSTKHLNRSLNPNKETLTIPEYVEATKITDSIIKLNRQFLDNYASPLPEWFIKTEKNDIAYYYAHQSQQLYTKLDDGARELVPVNTLELNNPDAVLSESYYNFISTYLLFNCPLLDNKLTGTLRSINQLERQTHLIDSMLGEDAKAYYVTSELSDLYIVAKTLDEIKIADNFIKTNYPTLPEANLKFINSRRNQMMKTIKTGLQKGDNAPYFLLKDINGKRNELSNFKGKSVYLHFWATDCESCLKEIPNIKKLHSKLGDKPVEIVNICMDNNPEKWKQIIEKENLTGINLICVGNWNAKLKEFYFIEELPHYVLIDKNGLVVTNKCVGPDDIYTELVKLANNK